MRNNFKSIIEYLRRTLIAQSGKNLGLEKIVVIESDDWGSIRMPSSKTYHSLVKKIPTIQNDVYNKYDTIASSDDIEHIASSLASIKDIKGNHPVITCNFITANPDFEAIQKDNFQTYYYNSFDKTLIGTYGARIMDQWKEAINQKIFSPEFHGRDHVNIGRWLKKLKENEPEVKLAFAHGVFGIATSYEPPEYFMATLDYPKNENTDIITTGLKEGYHEFYRVFEKKPTSFIAPCYIWDNRVEQTTKELGILGVQGKIIQLEPRHSQLEERKYKKRIRLFGSGNKLGQVYMPRNCFFEPASRPNFDWEGDCISRMKIAFKWGLPSIISSHRVNYIGGIEEKNRIVNLERLLRLIKSIINIWPDVEFISTGQLVKLVLDRTKQ